MTRVFAPYGSPISLGRKSQIGRRDVRVQFSDRRLIWQDGISAREGKLVLTSRYVENGKIYFVDATDSETDNAMRSRPRKTPIAFQPIAESSAHWNRIEISGMEVSLKDFHRVQDVCETVKSLGVPVDQGRNPLMCTQWRGKKVFIPTLTLIMALLMPSDPAFFQIAHPMACHCYVRQPMRPGHIDIRTSTNHTHASQFTWADLCCLAYWLSRDASLWHLGNLHEATFGSADFQLAPDPGPLKFCVDAYEYEGLIVVQNIGVPDYHSIWPIENTTITVSSLAGKVTHSLAVGPTGVLLRHMEYLKSNARYRV